jgi:periplasmic protein TonB
MFRRQYLPLFASVIALHALALWALQTGLLQRVFDKATPLLVMAEVLMPAPAMPEPPTFKPATPSRPAEKGAAQPRPQATPPNPEPAAPAPTLLATPSQSPATAIAQVTAANVSPNASPVQTPATPPAPAKVEQPSSDAQYLQNPKPSYPALSRRMGEQGKVVIRVLIGVEGQAQKAEIFQSSGYERLDQAALKTVLGWRYVPGKRGGVAEAMWFNVPINFVLE